jgi:hypothetical protein
MKHWKKPQITTLTEEELKKIIVASAWSGCGGNFIVVP